MNSISVRNSRGRPANTATLSRRLFVRAPQVGHAAAASTASGNEFAPLCMPSRNHALSNPFVTVMSASGHKQTRAAQQGMSALPPKADVCGAMTNVC